MEAKEDSLTIPERSNRPKRKDQDFRQLWKPERSTMEKSLWNYKNDFQSTSIFNQNLTKHGVRIKILADMYGLKMFIPEPSRIAGRCAVSAKRGVTGNTWHPGNGFLYEAKRNLHKSGKKRFPKSTVKQQAKKPGRRNRLKDPERKVLSVLASAAHTHNLNKED